MSDFINATLGVGGGLLVVILVLIGIVSKTGQGPTLRDKILSSPTLSPLLIIHYFLPYGLIVLVFFMDLMSQLPQGVLSLPIAFFLMLVNSLISKGIGTPDVITSDLCEIPGFKTWSSKFVPQSLLFVTTIVTYLAAFVTQSTLQSINATSVASSTASYINITGSISSVSPSPMTRIGASWGLALAVIFFQSISLLTTPGCLTNMGFPSRGPVPFGVSGGVSVLIAIAAGMLVGGLFGWGFAKLPITQPSYTVSTSATPNVNPFGSTQSKGPGFVREQFQLGSGLGEIPAVSGGQGGQVPVDIAKSSGAVTPGESSDQFVCEAYKNGQLVTSTLIE